MNRLIPSLTILLVLGSAQADPAVSHLKLRPQATVYARGVTLEDVLVFVNVDAAVAARLREVSLVTGVEAETTLAVTHAQVARAVDGLGLNLAQVLIGGALTCRVTVQPEEPEVAPPPLPGAGTGGAGADGAAAAGRTLADVLRQYVADELVELEGKAELQFDRSGEPYLGLTTPPWEFKVTSSGSERLGLREFRVLIRRDGRLQRTARLYAHVRVAREVVVARRPLSLGNHVRPEDVVLETRVFDRGDRLGHGSLSEVIGQQVKRFVAAGKLVRRDAIKSVDLVRRSRPVTVMGDRGEVQVRLAGVAMDSGGYGDSVRVRLGTSRRTRQYVRGMVTGLGTVRLIEGER
jgi:flagella basal body P-ring formation protein FlgA